MADRYYVESPITSDRATLAGPQAHHLLHVMRAGPGTEVVLFDGSGFEFTANVLETSRSTVALQIQDQTEVDRESSRRVTLAVALPKGDRQRWLVEKAVELGVTRIVPLKTQRCVAQPVEKAITRLRLAVIEASKQCGRNRLMEIDEPQAWVDHIASTSESALNLVAHPGGESLVQELSSSMAEVRIAIGPEGGFTDDEIAMAKEAGWRIVTLGPRILRVETAAVTCAARFGLGE